MPGHEVEQVNGVLPALRKQLTVKPPSSTNDQEAKYQILHGPSAESPPNGSMYMRNEPVASEECLTSRGIQSVDWGADEFSDLQ